MQNWILLKANLLKKKGTFLSVVVLTTIIFMVATMIFSVRDNYAKAVDEAFEDTKVGDMVVIIKEKDLTNELLSKVENSELVTDVKCINTLATSDANTYFMQKMRDGIKLFTKDEKAFADEIPVLNKGEIYLPLGVKGRLNCEVGDKVSFKTLDGSHEFVVKGFVQEPSNGASTIGWKQVFICDEEFEELKLIFDEYETEKINADYVLLNIYKADASMSDVSFQRKLNLETKISDYAYGTITKDQSAKYTLLFFEITSNVVLVFTGLLWVIVIIVMSHSITNEIENDYTNLSILKACGFSQKNIRFVISMQYVLAQIVGIIIGCVCAFPLSKLVSDAFVGITSILAKDGIAMTKILIFIVVLLMISILVIFVKTKKVSYISPVSAMNKGRRDVYFDSRFKLPISKKAFSISLSFRNITSNAKQYIGTTVIVAILVFFMLTVNLLTNMLNSKTALEAMGMELTDVDMRFKQNTDKEIFAKIEKIVEKHSAIEKKYYTSKKYMGVNGENLICTVYMHPEYIGGILKGRAPIYDNEIIVSDIVTEALEIKMGDKVIVSNDGYEAEYIISGIMQTGNDAGMAFAMSFAAAEKIHSNGVDYIGIDLEDDSKKYEIANEINEKLGDIIIAKSVEFEDVMGEYGYDLAVMVIEVIIYVLSIVFMLVVVIMVCSKVFIRERTDIGIQKALGLTSKALRFQFAVRFMLVAIIGSAFGIILSNIASVPLLNSILGMIGLTNIVTHFTVLCVVVPIVISAGAFFIFAYMASAKVKKVEVRELICE